MVESDSLVALNIYFLQQGINLLHDITDDHYQNEDSPHHKSSVGKHVRHTLEHYLSLVNSEEGKLDYDARNRDERIENDRLFAISVAEEIVDELRDLSSGQTLLEKPLQVKNNQGNTNNWCPSSIQRELQFLVSHTVHHYSLIAIILRIQGYRPNEEFGVAPSTLRYQQQLSNKATG